MVLIYVMNFIVVGSFIQIVIFLSIIEWNAEVQRTIFYNSNNPTTSTRTIQAKGKPGHGISIPDLLGSIWRHVFVTFNWNSR